MSTLAKDIESHWAIISPLLSIHNEQERDSDHLFLVVIFVSSHGSPSDLDSAGVNYIVTHDTKLEKGNRGVLYATAFPMEEFENIINKRIRAK